MNDSRVRVKDSAQKGVRRDDEGRDRDGRAKRRRGRIKDVDVDA